MVTLLGQLLFEIVRDLAEAQAKSIFGRIIQRVGAWLDTRIKGRKGRARLIIGLLIGFALWGILPLIGFLVAH